METSQAITKDYLSNAPITESVTIGRPLEAAIESLLEVYEESSKADWDGYGASPVTEDAFHEARKLIQLLPSSVPVPEILAEPTGEIGLEWYRGRHLTFVVSCGGGNILTYAGIFGINKIHGTEYFGGSLPSIIVQNLRRLYQWGRESWI